MLYVGTRPDSFYLLFPNRLDSRNEIAAGQELRLPRTSWTVNALGPPGTDHILVLVAESPRDLSGYALPEEYVSRDGLFQKLLPTPATAARLSQLATLSGSLRSPECAKRDLGVAQRCSNAFGAALVSIEEH
jgi:hypothetical protein